MIPFLEFKNVFRKSLRLDLPKRIFTHQSVLKTYFIKADTKLKSFMTDSQGFQKIEYSILGQHWRLYLKNH